MNIVWLFAETTDLGPTVDVKQLHALAPIWGGWKTWRGYATDNVVCYDIDRAEKLLEQGYDRVCNFYVQQQAWEKFGKPTNVRAFGGEFPKTITGADDIVAMHLAASQNQIVLMIGFDLSSYQTPGPYMDLAAQTIKQYPKTQWVLVDHTDKLAEPFQKLKNITCDNLDNVLKLLNSNS